MKEDTDKPKKEININSEELKILKKFIEIATNTGSSFPITLLVGGQLISGFLIPSYEYFELFGEQLDQLFSNDNHDECFAEIFSLEGNEEETEKNFSEKISYIHVKEAKFYQSVNSQIPSEGGTLWRGKISSIDGFSFGVLESKE